MKPADGNSISLNCLFLDELNEINCFGSLMGTRINVYTENHQSVGKVMAQLK